jgi:uncharacterized protein YcsI (UPF0317 family)
MPDTSTASSALAQRVRAQARAGTLSGHTAGLAPSLVQGNLMILPAEHAADFLLFCQRNPKPCPLLGVSAPGEVAFPQLGHDIDIRSDVPLYRVWRDGQLVEECADVRHVWRDDLVSFVIGCSFSFEQALMDAGVPLRHVDQGRNVAMYRTQVPTTAAGRFHGPLVVSMRPMKAAHAIRAVQITSRFPSVHGAPVHLGDPALIGIRDLSQPDYGDAVDILPDEIPVFWACGVTPQAVVQAAGVPFSITHAPGAMLVTDLTNVSLASL